MHHEGNLTITEFNKHQFTNLTSVGGSLEVRADFSAPNLTSVGGSLYVRADFSAPNLTSVEGETITGYKYLRNLLWPVLITDGFIRIGCQRHSKAAWAGFTDEQIEDMDTNALKFWVKHKANLLDQYK